MKKTSTLASILTLAALATGCATNQTSQGEFFGINPNQITLRASAAQSRANDNALVELKGGFNVIALDKAQNYIPGFEAPAGDNVTYADISGTWDWKDQTLKEHKLWPMTDESYPLAFFAAYPKTDAITKDTPMANVTVEANLTPATFAYNTYYNAIPVVFDAAQLSVDELASLSSVTRRPVTGFADLSFKHIMSNVKFTITVPTGHRAYIHSIKIANVNNSGRSYNYQTGLWSPEAAYTEANHALFAHFIASTAQTIQQITPATPTVNGLTDGEAGFNTLKMMPQKTVDAWILGAGVTPAMAGTFRGDAAAWKASLTGGVVDATAINKWHAQPTSGSGMQNSDGWKGSRIEVIYCLVDETTAGSPKNVIGYKSGVDGATADLMVRVGYILDLNTINSNAGWEAGKRYTFAIPLGTAGASNGTLLDPDYKDADGGSTDKPVDNPKTDPGDEITKGGVIQFNVNVGEWLEAPEVGIN